MTPSTESVWNPDAQPPLPVPAAVPYAQTVMAWARDLNRAGISVRRNIAYGDDPLQRYDVFSPDGAVDAPTLVFWHGGGWTNGYAAYAHFMAPHVTRRGMVLVTPSYRLAPQVRLDSQLDDALRCAAHVQRHAPTYGANGQRLLLAGHSAGIRPAVCWPPWWRCAMASTRATACEPRPCWPA